MDVKLVWERGGKRKQVFQLRSDEMVIGRQSGGGLRIPAPEVSRVHCRICREDGYVTVEDCASANGTFVNGNRITARKVLFPGDRLDVGPVSLLVEYQMTQATLDRLRAEEDEELVVTGVDIMDEDEDEIEVVAVPAPDEDPETVEASAVGQEEEIVELPVELDESEPWQLPEPDELRDILSQLEDSNE
jgi:pSer/pThr/pTyr-binding forkhead associated (FHA) protein